jgi:hypothetical protein
MTEKTIGSFIPDTRKKGWKYMITKISPKQRKAFQIDPSVTHQEVGFVKIGNRWRIGSKENLTQPEFRARYGTLMKKVV